MQHKTVPWLLNCPAKCISNLQNVYCCGASRKNPALKLTVASNFHQHSTRWRNAQIFALLHASFTKLCPKWVVGMCFRQHVHALWGVLLQEDLYGWLTVGHDRGNPGKMVSENRSEKRREESKGKRQSKRLHGYIHAYQGRSMAWGVWETLLNWFLEACSMSRASSLMNWPQSWFFSGGPDIMVSQTGSGTRGMVYRLQMVVLQGIRTQRQKSFCQQLKQRALQLHRAAPAGKDLCSIFNFCKCHAAREHWPRSRA